MNDSKWFEAVFTSKLDWQTRTFLLALAHYKAKNFGVVVEKLNLPTKEYLACIQMALNAGFLRKDGTGYALSRPDDVFRLDEVILPEWIDKELWDAWIGIRGKNANNPSALKLALRKLSAWRKQGYDPNQILDNSVNNAWRGIFPPKPNNAHQNNKSQSTGKGAIIV